VAVEDDVGSVGEDGGAMVRQLLLLGNHFDAAVLGL